MYCKFAYYISFNEQLLKWSPRYEMNTQALL